MYVLHHENKPNLGDSQYVLIESVIKKQSRNSGEVIQEGSSQALNVMLTIDITK